MMKIRDSEADEQIYKGVEYLEGLKDVGVEAKAFQF